MGTFTEYLENNNLSKETIRVYKSRIKYFVKNRENLDIFKNKSKNYINQTKNAIKHYHKMNDNYYHKDTIYLNKLENTVKKKPRKKEEPLQLKKVNIKINAIKDKRKKLAFRLQEISGLRISEIADLEKDDITFSDDYRLIVHVRHGKGEKQRKLKTLSDKYVYNSLKELTKRKGKLFHSVRTLQKQAEELNFHTHDLRKVFAQTIYYKFCDSKQKIDTLKKLLGHSLDKRNKTYLKYVKRDINSTGTKFDI